MTETEKSQPKKTATKEKLVEKLAEVADEAIFKEFQRIEINSNSNVIKATLDVGKSPSDETYERNGVTKNIWKYDSGKAPQFFLEVWGVNSTIPAIDLFNFARELMKLVDSQDNPIIREELNKAVEIAKERYRSPIDLF